MRDDNAAEKLRKAKAERRMQTLERGLLACYEIIDRIRKEMAELSQPAKETQP